MSWVSVCCQGPHTPAPEFRRPPTSRRAHGLFSVLVLLLADRSASSLLSSLQPDIHNHCRSPLPRAGVNHTRVGWAVVSQRSDVLCAGTSEVGMIPLLYRSECFSNLSSAPLGFDLGVVFSIFIVFFFLPSSRLRTFNHPKRNLNPLTVTPHSPLSLWQPLVYFPSLRIYLLWASHVNAVMLSVAFVTAYLECACSHLCCGM